MQSLVSVIVPVYNGAHHLAAALESVRAQEYRPLDVIVVDDGSRDETAAVVAEVARHFPELRSITQPHRGAAAARNAGVAAAHGAFFAFLDADDLWAPAKLRVQIAYLQRHPATGYVVAHQQLVLAPGAERPASCPPEWLERPRVGLVPSALVVRRSAFARAGAFDARYRVGEDTEWFARAKDAGVTMAIVPRVLVWRRVHPTSLTARAYGAPDASQALLRIVRESLTRQRAQSPNAHRAIGAQSENDDEA